MTAGGSRHFVSHLHKIRKDCTFTSQFFPTLLRLGEKSRNLPNSSVLLSTSVREGFFVVTVDSSQWRDKSGQSAGNNSLLSSQPHLPHLYYLSQGLGNNIKGWVGFCKNRGQGEVFWNSVFWMWHDHSTDEFIAVIVACKTVRDQFLQWWGRDP